MKRREALLLAAVSALAGCGMFGGGPKEGSVEISLAAGRQLNPGTTGRASPVEIHLFDLKSTASFEAANFDGLFEKERETLGPDLITRDELFLQPGEQKKLEHKLAPETRALGVAVAFRELERASWRASVALKPNARNKVTISLDGVTVIATVAQP
jgi:type VI secretion system protein VasD